MTQSPFPYSTLVPRSFLVYNANPPSVAMLVSTVCNHFLSEKQPPKVVCACVCACVRVDFWKRMSHRIGCDCLAGPFERSRCGKEQETRDYRSAGGKEQVLSTPATRSKCRWKGPAPFHTCYSIVAGHLLEICQMHSENEDASQRFWFSNCSERERLL